MIIDIWSKIRVSNLLFDKDKKFLLENFLHFLSLYSLMNISPHLLIDAVILSTALTITLILRAKGNSVRKNNEGKWIVFNLLLAYFALSYAFIEPLQLLSFRKDI